MLDPCGSFVRITNVECNRFALRPCHRHLGDTDPTGNPKKKRKVVPMSLFHVHAHARCDSVVALSDMRESVRAQPRSYPNITPCVAYSISRGVLCVHWSPSGANQDARYTTSTGPN
jgi:hypothetical protein